MTHKIFIDGQEGTTGLQIHERLRIRRDLTLLSIPDEARKDPEAKAAVLAEADLAILCLPDAAAIEAAALAGPRTRLIDASTAHRVHDDWVFGLPELGPEQRARIAAAQRVSNPGCYPTGFLLIVRPLIDAGILPRDYPLSVHAVSGYSGGGKKLISMFREQARGDARPDWTARPYAFGLEHKHVAEMHKYSGLSHRPVFCPIVGNYYQGMLVSVALHVHALAKPVRPADVHALYSARYAEEPCLSILPLGGGNVLYEGMLGPTIANGTNRVELLVSGHDAQILVTARYDNLGKGASGAAVQNLNLMLGLPELTGLLV